MIHVPLGAQYATGGQWRNNSRKNEGLEPKQKQYPAVDVTGDRSKVRCCKSTALNMPENLENSAVATGLKRFVFIPIQTKAMPKNAQTTAQLHSSHMLVK